MWNINRFFKRYILLSTISFLLLLLYIGPIQPTNAYMKMQPLDIGLPEVGLWLVWNVITAMIMPSNLNKPSDCFLMAYCLFAMIGSSALWGASGLLGIEGGMALLAIFVSSLVLYKVLIAVFRMVLRSNVRMIYFLHTSSYAGPLVVLLLLGVAVGVMSGQAGGFDLDSSYVRRLAGRESFPTGALTTYIFVMTLNGITPFLAFLSTFRRKYYFLLGPLLFSIYAYWLIGTKAPVLMTGMLAFVGLVFRWKKEGFIPMKLGALLGFLMVFALVEYLLTGYSYISDYFVRRAFAVVAQLQGVYTAYAVDHFRLVDWLTGSDVFQMQPVSMFLGNWYFDNPDTNANSNTLLYTLLQQGVVGLTGAMIFIAVVFALLDYLYAERETHEAMGVAFLYSVLLAEQAYSTAFLSSGIGLLLMIMILFRLRVPPNRENQVNKFEKRRLKPAPSLKTVQPDGARR